LRDDSEMLCDAGVDDLAEKRAYMLAVQRQPPNQQRNQVLYQRRSSTLPRSSYFARQEREHPLADDFVAIPVRDFSFARGAKKGCLYYAGTKPWKFSGEIAVR
jgi:hypothetical protein